MMKTEAQVIGRQMLRSGTSVGAQYREAIRAKSVADFINKVEGSLQELEETQHWFELLSEAGIETDAAQLRSLMYRVIIHHSSFGVPIRSCSFQSYPYEGLFWRR